VTLTEKIVKQDPATSFWLKEQLHLSRNRDPIDMLNDIETLKGVIESRIKGKCNA